MVIYVYRAGQFRPVTRIYRAVRVGIPKEVLLVQVAENDPGQKIPKLVTYHDRFQRPATGLRGVEATHGSAKIAWTAPPQATDYQVLMKPKKVGATTFEPTITKPNLDQWTQENFMDISGLKPDYEYTFTVRAKRTAIDGTPIVSPTDSNAITLATGHAVDTRKNPSYNADPVNYPAGKPDLVYINAARTDSWTLDYRWGASSRGPDVLQGYGSDSSLNHYSGIYYGTARSQLNTALTNSTTSVGLPASGLAVLLGKVQVVDARIDLIVRRSGGSANPVVHIYPSKLNFSSTARPTAYGGTAAGTTFTAPGVTAGHNTKDDFALPSSRLITWAREWIESAPSHNGMLIYNTAASGNNTVGHNGYCVFRAARASSTSATAAEWRLKLWVKWNHTFPELPPVWR